MESVEYLVVGGGISGLSFANWLREAAAARGAREPEILILEAEAEPGGYCRSVLQDGFVWDYSGHFFHFRHRSLAGCCHFAGLALPWQGPAQAQGSN